MSRESRARAAMSPDERELARAMVNMHKIAPYIRTAAGVKRFLDRVPEEGRLGAALLLKRVMRGHEPKAAGA